MSKEELENLLEMPDHEDESGDYYIGHTVRRMMVAAYNRAIDDSFDKLKNVGGYGRFLPDIKEDLEQLKIRD